MKLIDYGKYMKKWSPRSTIILAVVEAVVTGFFFSATLFEGLRRHDIWAWITPLVLGFGSAVGMLQATLVALHNCPPATGVTRTEVAPSTAKI